jgi:hypothetical protein
MTRELIVVSHTPFVFIAIILVVERCKVKGNSIVYVVDNVDDATDRRISTNIIHNGKI